MDRFKETKLYKFFNRDIKGFNSAILSIVCVAIIVGAGLFSYFITNSYALFSDEIESDRIIGLSVSSCKNNPNPPVLSENMIPVYYDEENDVWKKADSTNKSSEYKWYDYCDKMWANSVTVSSTNRQTYLDADDGTPISMDDILTMQVWIPRYKYTIWNYNSDGTVKSTPQEIKIEFEKGKTTSGEIDCVDDVKGTSDGTSTGTAPTTSEICKLKSNSTVCTDDICNGKTYTHPAFTFGNEELTGFWVGKFEVSSDISCEAVSEVAIGEECNLSTIRPLVKPNVVSWRAAMPSIFQNNMMAMNDSNNKYGFSSRDDTHVMKNMEWGAVAYLSYSTYGTCTGDKCEEISVNNSSSYYTGTSCGNSSVSFCEGTYKYNQTKIENVGVTGNFVGDVNNDSIYPWIESDGVYKSSTQDIDDSTTDLSFDFVVSSDDTYLSFDWSVSSESASYDYFYYTIEKDGEVLDDTGISTAIGGTEFGTTEDELIYENVTKILDVGSYKLTFTYVKDGSVSDGTDTGYVKNIKIGAGEAGVEVLPIEKGKDGPSASTTRNIYGIYDMSGGALEFVMANAVSPNGITMISGYRADRVYPNSHSGYSGILHYDGSTSGGYGLYTGAYEYPDDKYYDKYSFYPSWSERGRSKLGDAIKEVADVPGIGWFNVYTELPNGFAPWLDRGGRYDSGRAGVFSSDYYSGFANMYVGSRLVISPVS